jgi:hypothetical protein
MAKRTRGPVYPSPHLYRQWTNQSETRNEMNGHLRF